MIHEEHEKHEGNTTKLVKYIFFVPLRVLRGFIDLFLNPDNVHDSAGKEDQICEPCREQRLKVSVVSQTPDSFS